MDDYEELQLRTPDGESLHAYFIRAPPKRLDQNLTVLMFHGNAGNVGHRIPIAKVLQDFLGCHVLMLEYRGYGLSTGVPDENGLKIDAQTALDHLRQRGETADSRIIIYGQSLGGAVAINLVATNEDKGGIAGLILENTFLSIRKLIPRYVFSFKFIHFWFCINWYQRLPPGPVSCSILPPDMDERGGSAKDNPDPCAVSERIKRRNYTVSTA